MGLLAGVVCQENPAGVESHQHWEVEMPHIRSTVLLPGFPEEKKSFKDCPSFPEMFSGILSLHQCAVSMDL